MNMRATMTMTTPMMRNAMMPATTLTTLTTITIVSVHQYTHVTHDENHVKSRDSLLYCFEVILVAFIPL